MNRRSLIIGLGALFAAPAIVKAESLMPVRSIDYWDNLRRRRLVARLTGMQERGLIRGFALSSSATIMHIGTKKFKDFKTLRDFKTLCMSHPPQDVIALTNKFADVVESGLCGDSRRIDFVEFRAVESSLPLTHL